MCIHKYRTISHRLIIKVETILVRLSLEFPTRANQYKKCFSNTTLQTNHWITSIVRLH